MTRQTAPSTSLGTGFAPNPHRRAMLAKVHLAKKQLGLIDDDYRALLLRVTGQVSAADCSDSELSKLLLQLQRQGFRPISRQARDDRSAPKPADSPLALKARAMWISLHHLGVVENASEQALEAFARRQLKVERLQWANQSQGYKLVEALKAMAERAGWGQSMEQVQPHMRLTVLKRRLVEAILAKLKEKRLAASDWTVTKAAWSLLGEELPMGILFADVELLDRLARGFGAKLRGVGA